ncbi:MAG: NUDIX domain-containing protein [Defluviitaleaceae bacterium]|nr:NUDIX domain-containing protein [Defluviitaleaceae bacterium]
MTTDYEQLEVRTAALGTFDAYKYTVIFAQYQNKWLYCRAKKRDTFETAGGHVEPGETILEAAKREFTEETGAVKFDITPMFDYSVNSAGQVFLAQVYELGDMPDFEMAEIRLFDTIPDKMRFPMILPVLFNYLQDRLNCLTAEDEIWDVYDADRNLTGRTHRRADPLPAGDYHLVVDICLQNSKGELLLTQRAPNKGFPYMWENQGGSAVAGDDSLTTAIKEVKEEVGLDIAPENGQLLLSIKRDNCFHDVWLFRQDFDINHVVLQPGETIDAKVATLDQIREMVRNGEFYPIDFLEELFAIIEKLA